VEICAYHQPECCAQGRPRTPQCGHSLYLIVTPNSRRWCFRFTKPSTRKVSELGLGSAELLTLAEARDKAFEHRRTVLKGFDPVEVKRERHRLQTTFAEMANAYITHKQQEWRGQNTYADKRLLLQTYASPLATKYITDITSDDVASAVRNAKQRDRTVDAIRQVFDFAMGRGFCTSNPADRRFMKWRLPNAKTTTQHFKAMDYADVPDLVRQLRARQQRHVSISPYVIEFLILTACRLNEVTKMCWSEVNGNVWTIPANRTKSGCEHRVPLSDRALDLLKTTSTNVTVENGYVWSGRSGPISNKGLYLYLTKYMSIPVTLHGFRSSFRSWCAEQTDTGFHVAELCLAHAVGDATVRAYLRGDALEKRREVMQVWADFCNQ
jgi:integrase